MTIILIAAAILVAMLFFVDGKVNAAVRPSERAWFEFMRAWTDVVRSQWYLIPSAVVFLVSGFVLWGRPGSRTYRLWTTLYAQSLFVFVSVSGALLTTNIFKFIVGRGRPFMQEEVGSLYFQPLTLAWEFASFPSGHSTTAATLGVILMLWMPRLRWVFLVMAVFMCISRVAADAHYPSDIVAGFTVGLLFTIALARWLASHRVAFEMKHGVLLPRVAPQR